MSGENLPSKIQQALDRFDRENKRVGYACAYREVTTGYTLTQYGWETVDKDGEWVPGKGDKRWKDYSKRADYHTLGFHVPSWTNGEYT
ncbi:hypothetical protein FOXB_16995 [Fusarium oxysporum f. sp. conglutinans Fo5176]|uniref:Uncharacterized protein n=1 Tax=Fusarium oxysporum (strain Fo5176) TaxID=660025 RepID=F9GEB1_FUSOF|nr:hypothetical protein FOXB_16995 [Fusarium oxysporum f. sp. conglutinans Fo5176]